MAEPQNLSRPIEARFSVLLDTRRDCAGLMAECTLCGAITVASLDAAWHVGHVMCSECGVQTKLTMRAMRTLLAQADGAHATIARLIGG
jgi:transcription elongation factor Elf1